MTTNWDVCKITFWKALLQGALSIVLVFIQSKGENCHHNYCQCYLIIKNLYSIILGVRPLKNDDGCNIPLHDTDDNYSFQNTQSSIVWDNDNIICHLPTQQEFHIIQVKLQILCKWTGKEIAQTINFKSLTIKSSFDNKFEDHLVLLIDVFFLLVADSQNISDIA